jgi:phosphatidylserine/phosphatidylglycerophosphate/cardiolipin synthase-like enzyme
LIDGRIVWCGSGNFTAAAAHHNHEAYIRSEDVTIAAAIVSFYKKVLSSNG